MIPQWYCIESQSTDPFLNMAIDEALLENSANLGAPALRFYGWSEAAATFGYFQHYAEVASYTELRPLIRRPTGGGLVTHDHDWTYSLVFPPGDSWYELPAIRSYELLHQWIAASFGRLKIDTTLSERAWKDSPGQCFAGAERFDLLSAGRKIAGAAQRRSRHGLLIQGSVQADQAAAGRQEWQKAMLETCPRGEITGAFNPLMSEVKVRADFLAETKYRRKEYNQKR